MLASREGKVSMNVCHIRLYGRRKEERQRAKRRRQEKEESRVREREERQEGCQA